MDTELPPLEQLVDRRHADRRNALIAATVVAALVFLTVVASIYGLVSVNRSLERRADRLAAQLDADQAETDCIRVLSGKKSRAETLHAIANSDLVIAISVRGDIPKALSDLDTRKKELTAADAAYYVATTEGVDLERDCPAG